VVDFRTLYASYLIGNIFAPSNTLGTWTVCGKILERNSTGVWVIVQVKWGTKNWRFSTNISHYIGNDKIHGEA